MDLERSEARTSGLGFAKNQALSLGTWSPELNAADTRLLCDLIAKHKSIGIFAARVSWFEAPRIENLFNSLLSPEQTRPRYSFPRCGEKAMAFFECAYESLETHPELGVLEAPSDAAPANPTLIFTPCTFADLAGNRMGRGKGHYDHYFNDTSEHPNQQPCHSLYKVAVLHEDFVLDAFPSDWILKTDHAVDALLTNRRFFTSSSSTKETLT